jgi:ketosteroid isomerase-like protein
MTDLEMLEALNRDYIVSVQNGDVKRFGEILSDDFLNTNPDGSLVDKAEFLKQVAPPVKIRDLAIDEVKIRVMGDFAIVHARTRFLLLDGRPGQGRYTDIYAKKNGQWLCVAAQVARS